ncbi:2OG-Fe(II) oxygenase [Methylophaga lonarensis]|uniref:2OG-Fe(II) oxygenase n=1 Tax=Methylophaga lonarensis TaxID=999151 RepID=UPI003D2C1B9E
MSATPPPPAESELYDLIANDLFEQGYSIVPDAFSHALTHDLYRRVARLDEHNDLQLAGVGRETDFQINTAIRGDETRWLSDTHKVDAAYLQQMADFRLAINRRLFLGLFDYEAHYAHYAPSAFYKRHMDAFKGGDSRRVLTTVLYLNQDWQAADGGQLVIYDKDSDQVISTVMPEMGTLVVFLSEDFPHEVLACKRDRYSIAGWFRIQDPMQAPAI